MTADPAMHAFYEPSSHFVPEHVLGYLHAVKAKMVKDSVFYCSALDVVNYIRNVDLSAFKTSVRAYLKHPFKGFTETIPRLPNAFSDGSVKSPAHQAWACSTFGVVHMKNICSEELLNSLERDYAQVSLNRDGEYGTFYTCRAPIFGGHFSSSRAELAGVLLALSVHWPLHLVLDNLSTVEKLNELMRNHLIPQTRPWSLQRFERDR